MIWIKKGQIFQPTGTLTWATTHAAVPFAKRVGDDLYRIYFSGRDKLNRSRPGYILININTPQTPLYIKNEPLLECGPPGTFDDSGVVGSWLLDYNDEKYLYYVGWNLGVTVPFRNSMGLAVSKDDGHTFTKYSCGPILDRGIYDPHFVGTSCILRENNTWRMWYLSCVRWEFEGGKPKHFYHIKYAESENGIEWKRNGTICIDFNSEDEYAISRPCVVKDDNVYRMWYSYRGRSYRIGYAESSDGLQWERKDREVGIDVSESGWDSEMIEYPFVFDHGKERYMLYNGNGYGQSGIGLAVLAREE